MSHQQHLLRAVIFQMLFQQYQLLIRSSFDNIFSKTTIKSVEDKVNPVNLTNPIIYSMQHKDIYIF